MWVLHITDVTKTARQVGRNHNNGIAGENVTKTARQVGRNHNSGTARAGQT
jgi:hypothetical protein